MKDDLMIMRLIGHIRGQDDDFVKSSEKVSSEELMALRDELRKTRRIHARPRVAEAGLVEMLSERDVSILPFDVVVTKKGCVRDVLDELDDSALKILRNVLDLIRCSDRDLVNSIGPALCKPEDGEFMSLLHISGFTEIRNMVSSLVMQYDQVFGDDDDDDDDKDEHEERDDKRNMSCVRELLRETVAEMLFVVTSDDDDDQTNFNNNNNHHHNNNKNKDKVEKKQLNRCMTSQERRDMIRRCRELRMEMKIAEADFEAEHGTGPTGHIKDNIRKNGKLYRELRTKVREDAARCLQRAVRTWLLDEIDSPSSSNNKDNDVVVNKTWANVQELAQMSVKQLRGEKRAVKRDLKDFDREFIEKHGRKPSKKDKEPIRWQYERYNDLKLLIEGLEQADDDEITERRTRLRLEKRILQRSLRRYEGNFEYIKGRKVKYRRDIAPVKDLYQRYKELKDIVNQWDGVNSK